MVDNTSFLTSFYLFIFLHHPHLAMTFSVSSFRLLLDPRRSGLTDLASGHKSTPFGAFGNFHKERWASGLGHESPSENGVHAIPLGVNGPVHGIPTK